MKTYIHLFGFFFIGACNIAVTESFQGELVTTDIGENSIFPGRDEGIEDLYPSDHYFVFGKNCGMCSENCTVMFRVDTVNHAVFIDRASNYFSNRKLSAFWGKGEQGYKFENVKELLKAIPEQVLSIKEKETTFGCPDCLDQCLIYAEIGKGINRTYIYIDTDVSKQPEYLRSFVIKINKAIDVIK